VRKPLILSLLGTQLHEFTLNEVGKHLHKLGEKKVATDELINAHHTEHQGDVRVSETGNHLGSHRQDKVASDRHLKHTKYISVSHQIFKAHL